MDENQEGEEHLDVLLDVSQDMAESKGMKTRVSRKRTKTGCLTCRRRRIKCGEERPKCGNCVKSKRQCEGYTQRVIFKDPLSSTRFPASSVAPVNSSIQRPQATFQSAPRHQFQPSPQEPQLSMQVNATNQIEFSSNRPIPGDTVSYNLPGPSNKTAENVVVPPGRSVGPGVDTTWTPYSAPVPHGPHLQTPRSLFSSNSHTEFVSKGDDRLDKNRRDGQWKSGQINRPEMSFQEQVYHSNIRDKASAILSQPWEGAVNWSLDMPQQDPVESKYGPELSQPGVSVTNRTGHFEWRPDADDFPLPKTSTQSHFYETVSPNHRHVSDEAFAKANSGLVMNTPQRPARTIYSEEKSSVAEESYQWGNMSEDDPFDVTDDELEASSERYRPSAGEEQHAHLKNNDLGIMVALQAAQDRQDQSLRTYHSFIDGYGPEVLATYRPSARSSPLNDSMTARIFCHFINATAPCISMYERHPANPSLIFQGRPVPKSQQHLWAYTMPTVALSSPALLHAMLALGSLHMAKLQDGPTTAPLKHYHLAIRRIGKDVGLPTRRGHIATLAATMLLGWFEVMSADHIKWAGHILGAKVLLQGIDFLGMTRYLKNQKMQRRQYQFSNLPDASMISTNFVDNPHVWQGVNSEYSAEDDDVNENLVSMITGKRLKYDQYGQVLEDLNAPSDYDKVYTQREIENYETQRDLFWWFCRQDTTQSILGGTKLLMPYDMWSVCPPRAAVGRRDAIYGTWDHLTLLLGRVAEFSAKDLKRKRSTMKASPGAASQTSPAGQNKQSKNSTSSGGILQMPKFAGMLPVAGGRVALPRGFSPPREESPDYADDRTLEEQTRDAEEEWQDIQNAFNKLRDNFGPDFQALGPEYSQPIKSPFGPALVYRTFGIAGIWMSYYLGLIVLHRAHPSMPPAATIAVGVAAPQTGLYANETGRIAAGIAPNATEIRQVNTGIGAALIESSFPLFVAGVQFQDSAQRSWMIQRCFDMRRLTGWQTAHSIAIGCETSWKQAAEAGRGPSYARGPEWKTPSTNLDLDSRRAQILSVRENGRSAENFTTDNKNRVHYALGLLAVEEDLGSLEIGDGGDDVR